MADDNQYTNALLQQGDQLKQRLDRLIDDCAQTDSIRRYVEIIVHRDKYRHFIATLSELGVAIDSVGWWCHTTRRNARRFGCPHGFGGPSAKDGYFSELSRDYDEVDPAAIDQLERDYSKEKVRDINAGVAELVSAKRIVTDADDDYLVFDQDECLTPAFDLRVPREWSRESAPLRAAAGDTSSGSGETAAGRGSLSIRKLVASDAPALACALGVPILWAVDIATGYASGDELSIAIAGVGSIFLAAVFGWRISRAAALFRGGVTVPGRIDLVSIVRDRGRLEFSFEDHGTVIKAWMPVHASSAVRSLRPGDIVPILFDPSRPRRAIVRPLFEAERSE